MREFRYHSHELNEHVPKLKKKRARSDDEKAKAATAARRMSEHGVTISPTRKLSPTFNYVS